MILIRKVGSFIFYFSGFYYFSRMIERRKYGNVLRIVNYHDIKDDEVRNFKKQLRFLRKHYTLVGFDDLKKYLNCDSDIQNPLLLTFDDGLIGNYTHLFPLMKELSIPAMFFISPGNIGKNGYMTRNDIREMIDSGLASIGCHTYTHKAMNDELPIKVIEHEVIESKEVLEKMFGILVDSFCWTYGGPDDYCQYSFDCFIKAKYEYGFCTFSSPVLLSSDRRILPRTNIQNKWNLFEVRYQLSPHHDKKFVNIREICEKNIKKATTKQ